MCSHVIRHVECKTMYVCLCVCIGYIAMYAYEPQRDGDLAVSEGDVIVVDEMLDNGWWRGKIDDREGWFPGSYVQVGSCQYGTVNFN